MQPEYSSILFSETEIRERVAALGRQITNDFAGQELLVVGVLKGAAMFHADLTRQIQLPIRTDFVTVTSYGAGRTSPGSVKLKHALDGSFHNSNVLLVEDIVDSGHTLQFLMSQLREVGVRSVHTCALLSKPARREIEVDIGYVGFDIPNHFVIGYGMDFDGKYRNLSCIRILPPGK